jgi:cysteine-rich repeat protein
LTASAAARYTASSEVAMGVGWSALLAVAVLACGATRAVADIIGAGDDFLVNTYTTGAQSEPTIARARDAGGFVVVWCDAGSLDGSQTAVFGQRYTSAGSVAGPQFQVNTYTTGYQCRPDVAMTPAGGFVVVWSSDADPQRGVFGQRYDSAGGPVGTEFRVNSYTTGAQFLPRVAIEPSGTFVVVWRSDGQDGNSSGVAGRLFTSDGAPAGNDFLLNSYTTGIQTVPAVAFLPDRGFITTWEGPDASTTGIFARRWDAAGAPQGAEFGVNAYATAQQFFSAAAADDAGRFVVAWIDAVRDGSGTGIFARRFDSGGNPLGTDFQVNVSTAGSQSRPAVATDAAGAFVVTWFDPGGADGSGYGVLGRRFDSAGMPFGLEFVANTYTTGSQGYDGVDVAADIDGDFVVVWTSNLQDGSANGIFGRRFQDPCGDGTVSSGEQCDDGRRFDGDCCSKGCQIEPAGGLCTTADGNRCARCDGAGACVLTPCGTCMRCEPAAGCLVGPRTTCRRPSKARAAAFQLVNKSAAAKDRLGFRWQRGAVAAASEFGNPVAETDYTLCVFDRQGGVDRLVLDAAAPKGGTCRGRACWKATRSGFQYRDRERTPDGLAAITLKKGGRAEAVVAGQGATLALPALGLTAPVTVQLQGGPDSCFGAEFAAPTKNTTSLFKAKGN